MHAPHMGYGVAKRDGGIWRVVVVGGRAWGRADWRWSVGSRRESATAVAALWNRAKSHPTETANPILWGKMLGDSSPLHCGGGLTEHGKRPVPGHPHKGLPAMDLEQRPREAAANKWQTLTVDRDTKKAIDAAARLFGLPRSYLVKKAVEAYAAASPAQMDARSREVTR
jgi:hypothetical protein